jgi:radical SAM protein with 4Fe4S-binding SPASM domain
MRTWNRAKLLWAYLTRRERLAALPVEYIVETTAKCNLYCPMCPRESLPQPKEDMPAAVFDRFIEEAGATAEHMMLIGLGEPLLDPAIFDRVAACERHGVATLLSTNGTLLTEQQCLRLLDSPLRHITLSFDGMSPETFERYRKGARFENVRENFLRLARMKHAQGSRLQIVVQMVRMAGNTHEAAEFVRYWSAVEGVDQVRVKEDETNLLRPDAGHAPSDWRWPCHYLWRGPLYIKHNGDVYPCCQSYMLGGQPVGRIGEQTLVQIVDGEEMQRMRRLHVAGRAGEIDICRRCCTVIPHPLLVAGSLFLSGETVRRLLPWIERLIYAAKLPRRLLTPPRI